MTPGAFEPDHAGITSLARAVVNPRGVALAARCRDGQRDSPLQNLESQVPTVVEAGVAGVGGMIRFGSR
eukprot:CAMPEP_0197427218 /NCGR_PEP_ID=MMETSP1170-20131217/37624_1 /TAXON_ID=54406 /ORGANISM="Sarcinochrysis sp, Strain CCMP770" /LENGTH=68 /DNA_ID=CAMNT_0042954899 /DNA_START=91 /DNA_END=293 /DNA_ORIENTATION=-